MTKPEWGRSKVGVRCSGSGGVQGQGGRWERDPRAGTVVVPGLRLSSCPRCISHNLELSGTFPVAPKLPAPHTAGGQGHGTKIHRGYIFPRYLSAVSQLPG